MYCWRPRASSASAYEQAQGWMIDMPKTRLVIQFVALLFGLSGLSGAAGLAATPVEEGPELVPNGRFEGGGAGAPWVPMGWQNGEGSFAFAAGELTANKDDPISGRTALEINTLPRGDGKRVLYARITVLPGRQVRISYKARRIAGDGNVTLMLRESPYGGATYFLEGGRIGPGKGRNIDYTGHYYVENHRPYLVIETDGPAHVMIDDISIARHEDRRYHWTKKQWVAADDDWYTLSEEVVTPHIKWARPYAGGALKLLSIAPRWRHRWTVELAQRLSMDYEAVMFKHYTSMGGDYWVNTPEGLRYFEITADALQKIADKPDCIVITEVTAESIRPALVQAILERVAAGGGLVIREIRPNNLAGYTKGAWEQAIHDKNLTEVQTDYVALGTVKETDIRFYNYGRGRIAVLGSMESSGPLYSAFESETAFTIKAILWASGKLPKTRISSVKLPGEPGDNGPLSACILRKDLPAKVLVTITGAALPDGDAKLAWWIEDAFSENVHESSLPWPDDAERLPVSLPRMKGGRHHLHLQLLDGEKVLDWTSVALDIESEPRITGIRTRVVRETNGNTFSRVEGKPPYYTQGEKIRGSVQLSAPLAAGQRLWLTLTDRDGNIWQSREIHGGGVDYEFALGTEHTVVLVHAIRAQVLANDGEVISEAEEEVTVIRSPQWYANHFDFQVWAGAGEDYLGYLLSRTLRREFGITSTLTVGKARFKEGRNEAWNNIRGIRGMANMLPGSSKIVGDEGEPIRKPCLTDPKMLRGTAWNIASWNSRFYAGAAAKYAPLAYLSDHEQNMLGRRPAISTGVDFCFSSTCLEYLRNFLRQEYQDLDALNNTWGTDFKTWDAVRPLQLKDAIASGNIASWVDHRRSMDRVWLDFERHKVDAARRFDPLAEGVADNLQSHRNSLNSWSGVDYWLLFSEVLGGGSLVEPYKVSFVPEERKHLTWMRGAAWHPGFWTAHHRDLLRETFGSRPWQSLLGGNRGYTYYAETWYGKPDGYIYVDVAADLRPTSLGRIAAEGVRQIRTGIDRLVYESRRDDSGIGLHYSRSSEHVATAWQAIHGGSEAVKALDPRRIQFLFFRPALRMTGRSFRSIAYGQIERGMLATGGIKLLILPFSQAVSQSEADQIREFVRNGGVVLADIRPAMSDQHGFTRQAGLLDDVFGVRHEPEWRQYQPREGMVEIAGGYDGLRLDETRFGPALLGPEVELAGAVALGRSGDVPLMLIHKYGRGKAVLLNFTLRELGIHAEAVGQIFDSLFEHCGIGKLMSIDVQATYWVSGNEHTQFSTLEQYGHEAMPEIARYINGGIDILGFWYYAHRRGLGEQRLRVTPPRSGHIYDLRTNEYLGRQDTFEVTMALEGLRVYAVTPYRIEKPEMTVRVTQAQGGNAQIECRVTVSPRLAAAERHVVRLQLFAPDGSEWKDFNVNRVAENGAFTHVFTLPLNAPEGTWTVHAREAISGLSAKKVLTVKSKPLLSGCLASRFV